MHWNKTKHTVHEATVSLLLYKATVGYIQYMRIHPLSIHPINTFIHPFIHYPSIHSSINPFIHLSTHLSIHSSIHPSIRSSMCWPSSVFHFSGHPKIQSLTLCQTVCLNSSHRCDVVHMNAPHHRGSPHFRKKICSWRRSPLSYFPTGKSHPCYYLLKMRNHSNYRNRVNVSS